MYDKINMELFEGPAPTGCGDVWRLYMWNIQKQTYCLNVELVNTLLDETKDGLMTIALVFPHLTRSLGTIYILLSFQSTLPQFYHHLYVSLSIITHTFISEYVELNVCHVESYSSQPASLRDMIIAYKLQSVHTNKVYL